MRRSSSWPVSCVALCRSRRTELEQELAALTDCLADAIAAKIDRWRKLHPALTLGEIHRALQKVGACIKVSTCIDCGNPLNAEEQHYYEVRCEPCEEMWAEMMASAKRQ